MQSESPNRQRPAPKKSLGQHFLKDRDLSARIVSLAGIEAGEQVMEIGPGPGALTALLRERDWARLLLLEKDDHYAALHASQALPGLEVRHMDAMLFPWATLDGPWIIIGNLPYNIASPLMWDITSLTPQWKRAVFMIQKEVADRIVAPPGNKVYGGLSVWLQSYARVRRAFNVPPGAFSPPPRVDSSVIVLEPLPADKRPQSGQALASLIKSCFSHRRKQLQAILRQAYPEHYHPKILAELGMDPQSRPENLNPAQFQALAMSLTPKTS